MDYTNLLMALPTAVAGTALTLILLRNRKKQEAARAKAVARRPRAEETQE